MLVVDFQSVENETMNVFRDYLTDYLSRPGALSQRKLAARAGISHVFLNRVILGKSTPSLPIAERIVFATGSTLGRVLAKIEKTQSV